MNSFNLLDSAVRLPDYQGDPMILTTKTVLPTHLGAEPLLMREPFNRLSPLTAASLGCDTMHAVNHCSIDSIRQVRGFKNSTRCVSKVGNRCEFRRPLGTRKQSHSSLSSGTRKSNREDWGNLFFSGVNEYVGN